MDVVTDSFGFLIANCFSLASRAARCSGGKTPSIRSLPLAATRLPMPSILPRMADMMGGVGCLWSAYQALQKEIRTGLSRMGEFECLRLCADDVLENCSSERYSKMWVRVVTRRKHAGEAQAGLKEI